MSILDKLNNKEIKLSKSHKILLEYIKKFVVFIFYYYTVQFICSSMCVLS